MATAGLERVLDHLRKTLNPTELTGLTDRQLLARLEARCAVARRRAWERQEETLPQPAVLPIEPCDWQPLLDQELRRLPEKYRTAIVLCALEGRSRREAALLLGIHEGTLSSRLASARKMLADRLTRRGVAPAAGALAVLAGEATAATVPPALVRSTITVAALVAAGVDAAVTTTSTVLMKGVLKAMFLQKLKWTAVVVMATTMLGAGGLVYRAGNEPAARAQAAAAKPVSESDALRKENELLKLNLQVVLEKVRAQEAELRELKEQRKVGVRVWDADGKRLREEQLRLWIKHPEAKLEIHKPKLAANPLKEIDDALKLLHEAKDKDGKRRATEMLEKATKKLREELKEGGTGGGVGR